MIIIYYKNYSETILDGTVRNEATVSESDDIRFSESTSRGCRCLPSSMPFISHEETKRSGRHLLLVYISFFVDARADEKIRSQGTLVAGIHNLPRATFHMVGNVPLLSIHHLIWFAFLSVRGEQRYRLSSSPISFCTSFFCIRNSSNTSRYVAGY